MKCMNGMNEWIDEMNGDVIVNKTRIINGKSMTSSQQSKMAAMKRMDG